MLSLLMKAVTHLALLGGSPDLETIQEAAHVQTQAAKGRISSEGPVLLTLACRRTSPGMWAQCRLRSSGRGRVCFSARLSTREPLGMHALRVHRSQSGSQGAWGVPEPVEGLGLWLLLFFSTWIMREPFAKLWAGWSALLPTCDGMESDQSFWFVQTVPVEPQNSPALVSRLPTWCFPTWLWKVLEEPGIALSTSGNPSGFWNQDGWSPRGRPGWAFHAAFHEEGSEHIATGTRRRLFILCFCFPPVVGREADVKPGNLTA